MIDEKRIADFFAELVSIDSPSLEEREMADTLKIKFAEIGVTLTEDHTQEQTGSNAGNLFAVMHPVSNTDIENLSLIHI